MRCVFLRRTRKFLYNFCKDILIFWFWYFLPRKFCTTNSLNIFLFCLSRNLYGHSVQVFGSLQTCTVCSARTSTRTRSVTMWLQVLHIVNTHGHALLPPFLDFPHVIIVKLLRLPRNPPFHLRNDVISVIKAPTPQWILHLWEEEEVTWCEVGWIRRMQQDLVTTSCSFLSCCSKRIRFCTERTWYISLRTGVSRLGTGGLAPLTRATLHE